MKTRPARHSALTYIQCIYVDLDLKDLNGFVFIETNPHEMERPQKAITLVGAAILLLSLQAANDASLAVFDVLN